MKLTDSCNFKEKLGPSWLHIKKQRCYFAHWGPSSQSYGFSSSHVWMWELDYKESWALKNWCFWTVVLENLESPLDCKEIQPANSKGNQSWMFIGNTDAEAETPILWPPDAKNWLFGKDPGAEQDWRQEEKWMIEYERVGWFHQFSVCQFEQAQAVGDGQGSLECCSPWGHKESDTTKWSNWADNYSLIWNGGFCLFLFGIKQYSLVLQAFENLYRWNHTMCFLYGFLNSSLLFQYITF